MKSVTFTPKLSDRDALLAAGTRWLDSDGNEIDGPELAKRLWSFGVISNASELYQIRIGGCIKTGVSAYERIA